VDPTLEWQGIIYEAIRMEGGLGGGPCLLSSFPEGTGAEQSVDKEDLKESEQKKAEMR